MFTWYRNAQVCYAYLSDVPTEENWSAHYKLDSPFRKSKWFTRGWTLQELLAPEIVIFLSEDWEELGTKDSLADLISAVTSIGDLTNFNDACIAAKMSWASSRKTTRVEDQAYCLMGLFGVNMPPLYGEGVRAFIRLQLEILRVSDDESIFAWKDPNEELGGLLARSPIAFQHSGDIVPGKFDLDRPAYSMTNKGLRLELFLLPPKDYYIPKTRKLYGRRFSSLPQDAHLAPLNCKWRDSETALSIFLKKTHHVQFERVAPNELVPFHTRLEEAQIRQLKRTRLFVKQPDLPPTAEGVFSFKFSVNMDQVMRSGFRLAQKYHSHEGHFTFYEQFVGKNVFVRGEAQVAFLFTRAGRDVFAVSVESIRITHGRTLAAEILIVRGDQQLPGVVKTFLKERGEKYSASDRCSVLLDSGESVLVALRKATAVSTYVLDISINEDGRLPWPDSGNQGRYAPRSRRLQ